jgi:CheY-like chemotaxis protein
MNRAIDDVRGSSVFVVADDSGNLHLLAAVLKHGCLVPRAVLSGSLAIEATAIELPDLVLLDSNMPEMTGLDVYQCMLAKPTRSRSLSPVLT